MPTEDGAGPAARPGLPHTLWLVNLAAILVLTVTGGSLRIGLLSLAPTAMRLVGWLVPLALLAAFAWWLVRAGRHAPPARLALAVAGTGAILVWTLTIPLPSERMHLLLFGTLGATASVALGLGAGLLFVLGYAGLDELLQLYLPGRIADWNDVLLNVISGAAGWLVAFAHRGIAPQPAAAAGRLPP